MHYKMHSTNISTLETVFVIVHFVSEIFSSLAAAVFHLRLVAGGVWGLVCQLVMWLLGMGDCLNPVPWAPADQMLNGLGKMIGKCCASLRSHSELLGNPSPSTNIRGPFIFSQTGFSSLTQAAKEVEEWSRESPPTRKNGLPEHNCPCCCHIILLYLITELPMNFSWDKGIKHLSSSSSTQSQNVSLGKRVAKLCF